MHSHQFEVNPQKCNRSGICVSSCPMRIITIDKKDKLPRWIEGAEKKCLRCERCVASCPNQAISLKKIRDEEDEKSTNNLFKINHQTCRQDGLCAAVCPLQLITLNRKDGFPAPIEKAEKQCIHCGHCVAVCPYGALALATLKPGELSVAADGTLFYGPISLQTMKPEECVQVNAILLPTADQVKHFLTARRSIRAYKSQPVARDVLSGIIDTARYAPTGRNTQPVNWLVIEDANEVRLLASLAIDWMRQVIKEEPGAARNLNMTRLVADWDQGVDRVCHGAPHVIVAHAEEDLTAIHTSCTIALTYLELAAFSTGLGACWAGFFNAAANFYPPMTEALRLPNGHQCFGAMLVGYPRYQYHRIPSRKKAVVTWR
ncbi:MAG: Coenzyme F420:L-glutamate ligase [Pelotomaculum sp. PtaB.Bin104]|nr:MAG: Coenzyme F420:L-glutamate ligase [Pelotomaculum sp. PtaB.Bin104]